MKDDLNGMVCVCVCVCVCVYIYLFKNNSGPKDNWGHTAATFTVLDISVTTIAGSYPAQRTTAYIFLYCDVLRRPIFCDWPIPHPRNPIKYLLIHSFRINSGLEQVTAPNMRTAEDRTEY